MSLPFTSKLWDAAEPVYNAILNHNYMQELVSGDLPISKFSYYLIQDYHFLQAAARAIYVVASKAHHDDWIISFNRCSTNALMVERSMHEAFFKELKLSISAVKAMPISPTNEGYSSYLLVSAHQDSFAEALAALLPCFWVYRNLGQALLEKGPKYPIYQKWVSFYGASDYDDMIDWLLELTDEVGAEVPQLMQEKMKQKFIHSCKYEWLFWEMSYKEELWPNL